MVKYLLAWGMRALQAHRRGRSEGSGASSADDRQQHPKRALKTATQCSQRQRELDVHSLVLRLTVIRSGRINYPRRSCGTGWFCRRACGPCRRHRSPSLLVWQANLLIQRRTRSEEDAPKRRGAHRQQEHIRSGPASSDPLGQKGHSAAPVCRSRATTSDPDAAPKR